MDEKALQLTYHEIYSSLTENLNAQKILLAQANKLYVIVEGFDDTIDPSSRKAIESALAELYHLIDEMAIKTEKLFDSYDKITRVLEG